MGASQQALLIIGAGIDGWNPATTSSDITLSNFNKTAVRATSNNSNWRTTISAQSRNSGKYYFEVNQDVAGAVTGSLIVGVATSAVNLSSYTGSDAASYGIQSNNSILWLYNNNTTTGTASGIAQLGTNGRAMIAVDFAGGKIWVGADGAWANSGNPAAGINPTWTFTAGTTMYMAVSEYSNPQQITLCATGSTISYSPPSGFSTWL